MRKAELSVGQVVVSKAGRDEGRPFLVLKLVDGEYALLADGALRKVDKPKKKKVSHLRPTGEFAPALVARLGAGDRVEDFEVRQCLSAMKPHEEG